jgi:hypothetical protein
VISGIESEVYNSFQNIFNENNETEKEE